MKQAKTERAYHIGLLMDKKDDPHLSALPAVFDDAVMDDNLCHLSNYSVFIPRESPDILAGDNRANRSVSLTSQESGYLFVFSGTSPAPTLAKNGHLFVFLDL